MEEVHKYTVMVSYAHATENNINYTS